jgi:hypothetical protein
MAQAILLSDVDGLGTAGEAVDVSAGYLRNFLIPRKLAQPATQASLEGDPAAFGDIECVAQGVYRGLERIVCHVLSRRGAALKFENRLFRQYRELVGMLAISAGFG